MKSLLTPLTAAAMLAFAPQLNAQEPAQEPAPPASPPAQPPSPDAGQSQAEVSDQDLETFADIYIELEETLSRYEEELAAASTAQEAQETQARLQQDAFDRIAEHGWTPDQYNRVAQAINASPALRERAIALIDERS